MKKVIRKIIFIGALLLTISVYTNSQAEEPDRAQDLLITEDQTNGNMEPGSNQSQNGKSRSINIDMGVLYGIQYDQMASSINLSQEGQKNVYLLSSKFNRSGDFGYNEEGYVNSGFYENQIGFTLNRNWDDSWKTILELYFDNDSRGMFDNNIYSHEEKDKQKGAIKNIIKFTPTVEGYLTVGSAQYKHRLIAVNAINHVKSKLNQGNVIMGGEYIWSASNRIRVNSGLLYYDYSPDNIKTDEHIDAEAINDFNITNNLGLSIGVNYDYNKDRDRLISPIAGLLIKGFKYFSTSLLYRYDLVPFKPEDYYLEQNYIYPTYDLPPGKVYHGEMKTDVRVNSSVNVNINFTIEKNDNFYNYYTENGNVLSADTTEAIWYNPGLKANFILYKKIWELGLSYEYSYYDAEEIITYKEDHKAVSSIKFNGKKWKFEWNNRYKGRVNTNSDAGKDDVIEETVIGSFGLQRSLLEGSYGYLKVENLYNTKYVLRKDYPEPGISFLGGLRILI